MLICLKNSYGTIDKSIVLGPALWPHFDLIFVHSGQINLVIKDTECIELDSSQAILIYPNTKFQGGCITDSARISVHHFRVEQNPNLSSTVKSFHKDTNGCRIYPPVKKDYIENDIERAVNLSLEPYSVGNQEQKSLLIELILAQLQSANVFHKKNESIKPEFLTLIDWLKENLGQNITLDMMAEKTGYSKSYFRYGFRKQLGVSPIRFLITLRVERAAVLLRETLIPIKNIGILTGFPDIVHFYHTFRSYHKMTPREYRKQSLPLV